MGENDIFEVLERYPKQCVPLKVVASLHKTQEGGGGRGGVSGGGFPGGGSGGSELGPLGILEGESGTKRKLPVRSNPIRGPQGPRLTQKPLGALLE